MSGRDRDPAERQAMVFAVAESGRVRQGLLRGFKAKRMSPPLSSFLSGENGNGVAREYDTRCESTTYIRPIMILLCSSMWLQKNTYRLL